MRDARIAKFGRTANINMLTPFNTLTTTGLQTQLTRRFSDGSVFGCRTRVQAIELRRQQRFRPDL